MSSTDTRDRAREVLIHLFDAGEILPYGGKAFEFSHDADLILTALADAGIRLVGENEVVVDAGRFERLQKCGNALDVAVMAHAEGAGPALPALLYGAWKRMQPGDLDPADEPVAGEERQGRVRAIKRGELKLGNDVEAEMMADAGEAWEG